jgi:hypothetical protein
MKINIVISLIISCLCHNANAQLITNVVSYELGTLLLQIC